MPGPIRSGVLATPRRGGSRWDGFKALRSFTRLEPFKQRLQTENFACRPLFESGHETLDGGGVHGFGPPLCLRRRPQLYDAAVLVVPRPCHESGGLQFVDQTRDVPRRNSQPFGEFLGVAVPFSIRKRTRNIWGSVIPLAASPLRTRPCTPIMRRRRTSYVSSTTRPRAEDLGTIPHDASYIKYFCLWRLVY